MAHALMWTLCVSPFVIFFALVFRGLWGYRVGRFWRLGIQWGVENIMGIRPRVLGLENMPKEACVILSKHQSAWETMTVQDYVPAGAFCVFVLKKELLQLPFVGWGLAAMKMISIDRKGGASALEQVFAQGTERLRQGFYVVIFPEGTRVMPGQTRRYQMGGASLACHAGVKVVPIAHNAGELWGRRAFIKTSGEITISIGPALDATDLTPREVNQYAEQWIEAEMRRLSPHRY